MAIAGSVIEVRTIVRILAVLLLGVLAILVFGQNAPEGTFFEKAFDTIMSVLRMRWFPLFNT